MASLAATLAASRGPESVEFLNDMIAQLWPHINIAGSKMAKEIIEPILDSTLPGPLSSLRFVKLDLGQVPVRVAQVDVHKMPSGNLKLDMDIVWEGQSDVELDCSMVPKIGIEHIHLKGQLSVLLGPLMDVMPIIGAAQVAFINPPELEFDFTDAADIADSRLIRKTVRKVLLNIISSIVVLPNRILVKLDAANDYFKTYQPHLGVLRLTVGKATGIVGPEKSGAKRLLAKLVKDVPDCYTIVNLGAEPEWRTSTKKNDTEPEWNESHDFLVTDYEQSIFFDVNDEDLNSDDDIGVASTTIKEILLAGGMHELQLTHNNQPTDARLTVHAEFHHLIADAATLSPEQTSQAEEGQICGLATILVASALGLQGMRDDLKPSVKITWGTSTFSTATKSYNPGTDIFNPSFDEAFRIPITKAMVNDPASFRIALMNEKSESGFVEIPFSDVLNAPDSSVADGYEVGGGASVRVSISLRGLQRAE